MFECLNEDFWRNVTMKVSSKFQDVAGWCGVIDGIFMFYVLGDYHHVSLFILGISVSTMEIVVKFGGEAGYFLQFAPARLCRSQR